MKKLLLFAVFLILPYCSNAQLFVNNVTQTPAQLVQNVLLGQGVVVSNITYNGTAANATAVRDQVGFFTTGITPTNLGIAEGLILATGNATLAEGPNNANNASDPTGFPIEGDPDLLALANGAIRNKSVLEFDFVPTGNQLSFNFVFASEEYPEYVDSGFNDVFGFFLRGPGIAGPFTGGAANVALIPTTTTGNSTVSINNVNAGNPGFPGCPFVPPGANPSNPLYYVNNCGGASIQYDGFTTVLTASATVQCGQLYHIKLAISNVGDNAWDSAVFLQANSFNVNPIDLGDDYLVGGDSALCAGETQLLDTGLGNSVPHQWYLDGVAIAGATNSTYLVTEPGVFSVVAFPFGAGCPIDDAITVEYFEDETDSPIDLTECVNLFDLTENTATILGTLDPNDYEIAYFLNQTDAENFANEISNPTTFVSTSNPQTIYAGISGFVTGCVIVKEFEISVISCTLDPQPNPLSSCDDNPVDGFTIFDLTQSDTAALNGLDPTLYTVTYHNSQADANTGNAPITPATAYNGFNGEIVYVRVEENAAPTTFGTTSFALTINPTPSIADVVQTICSGDTFTVTPTNTAPNVVPTGTTYTWTVAAPAGITGASNQATAQTSISQTLTNTTSTSLSAIYTVTASVGTAPNICTDTFDITVTVNPKPSIADVTQAICTGNTFTVTPTNTAPDVVPTGTTYTWTVTTPAGITGASNQATAQTSISQTLTNATSNSIVVTYTVTASFGTAPNSCTDTFAINVTVNPEPQIADVVQTICSGDTFTVTPTNTAPNVVPTGTTYTWTVATPAGITGASNQATAQTSISQTLTNTTSTSLSAIYTVTASVGTAPNICTDTFDITVTVNPKPSIADVTQAICTGNTFTVTPTNTAPDVVPTGTTYTWTVTTPAGITGASNQATAQTSISQTLSNSTSNSIVVTYTVTASFGTAPNVCTDTFTIAVTVNPEPSIADVVQTICSGDTFTVTPTNTAPNVVPTGTTYTWTVATPAGITGASNQATAQTSISQTLTNTTSTSLSAIYTVTASVGTAPNICTDTFDITVTVNPKPSIADVTQAICTGNTFTVTPTNTAPDVVPTGTTYTWTVTTPAGITGASNQATAQTSISQTLSNSTSNSIVVTYTVTASFGTAPNSCTDTFAINVTVNPEPQIADVVQTICSGDTFTVTPTNTAPNVVPTGTTYTWTVVAPAGITGASNQATAQTSISQTLTNTTSTSLSAIYTVTASVGTAPNICTDTFDITVTVNPKPSIADVTQAICTGNTFTVTPTNTAPDVVPTGTTYTWTVTTPAGITGASNQATAQTSISQTLSNSTSNSIVVTYTVTASFGTAPNVCTDTFTIAVTVNPEPSIADVVQTICSGDTFTVTPSNTAPNVVPTGTTYTWTVAAGVGITGASNQATAQTSISQTLTNTTLGSLSAIYTVTASAGTAPTICTDTFTITVTVNPNPNITDVTQTICSGDTFTVTPTNTAPDVVPMGTTYTWTVTTPAGITGASNQATAQTSISQTLNNTTSSAINVVYTVTASFGTAPTVCTDTFSITVTVNPNPSIVNKTQTICSGTTFTVTPSNTAPDVVPTGTTYTWSVAAAAGITGASNQATAQTSISQTLINTTSTNLDAVYTVTATFGTAPNSCSSSFNITVTVIPNPTITDVTQTICSTGTFTVTPTNTAPDVVPTGTTYTWTVATPAGITGASNQGTAQTSISQTLTNTTSSAINVVYTVTASVGTAPTVCTDTFIITITVNPKPSIANKTQTICSGTTFSVTPTDTAPDVVPTGTTYTWTVTAPAGITGASNQATAQTAISQTLSNTTNAAISAVYTVTAFSGVAPNVCTNTFIVTVTVNPNPVITNKTQTICSTGTFTVTPTNTAPDVVPTGTTYTWTVTTPAGITGASNQATAQTSISQTLTNTTSAPINVIYAVTASSGTAPNVCTGTFIITVTVNPKPSIANKTQAICSTETFTVSPIDGVDVVPIGTTYTWTVTAPAGITGASNQATGQVNISQALTNTTTAPLNVIYTVTASYGLAPNVCTSTFIVTVTVNPLPTASIAGTITICPSTEATITFTGTANATVEYTVNGGGVQTLDLDASGFGSITETFTTTTTYVLVGVFSSGTPVCSVLLNQSATVSVLPAPLINMPADLVNCDDNNDGISIFDLTQTIAFITGGNPNVTVTFHETADDALLGGAPIQTPSNYTSIDPNFQTIYVRVVNTGTTDCPSVTSFNLIVNPYPVINLTPDDYALCDLNSDTQEIFDLTTTIPNILGTLNPALHTVTFYETQAEAEAGTPQITGVTTYTSVTHTVWVRVTINATGCYSVVPLELIVNPLPIANIPTPLSLCDVNNPGDQQEAFDMTLAIPDIVGTQVGMQVTFHLTLAQAQAGTNALPTTYTNTSNVQPIHVRVFDPVTGCFSTTILDLRVEPLPLLFPIGPTVLCDDNNDGIASFDLAALVSTLLNGASPSDITVTFHETEQQAQDGSDVIDTTVLYQTIDAGQQTLYVRAQDNATGCVSVRAIVLVVNPRPEMPTLPNLTQCDTDSNTQNGLSTFNLSVQTPVILAAQSGAASGYQVRYFTTEQNAIDNVSWIATPNSYPSTSNPQIIWVRVTHLTSGCYRTGSFELIVNIPLALTFPTPLSLCDEGLPNDQFTVFDLTVRTNEITQGLGGYTVAYYPSYQNALDNVNVIQNPAAYTNAVAAVQTLGVRVTSAEGCHSYTTLTIRVLPLPEPLTDPLPIEACDDNNPGDGIETFDLTLRAVYILNGASQTEFALTYYETEADANAGTNAIADPTNYTSTTANTQTIWVRVTRIPGVNEPSCYQLVQLQLIVNPLPVIAESPIAFYQCEPIDDYTMAFVLSTMNPRVLGSTQSASDYTVSYYLTAADALAGTPQLPNVYTNISSPQTIYVRVENNLTGCVNATGEVILEVEEGTQANAIPVNAPETTQCDTIGDNDGIYTFDLSGGVTPILIGTNNPTGTVVYYYESLSAAQLATTSNDYSGAIATPSAYNNTVPQHQTLYAVLVNPATNSKCPTITPVELTVFLLPEPTPEGGTICLDPETGALLNDYTLESNLNPLTHTFVWTNAAGTVMGTGASLTVTEPDVYTVVATHTATGCVSEAVTAAVVHSQQATLTYVVSNYFTDNQTITVIATGTTIPNQNNDNYLYSIDYGPFQVSNVFTNVGFGWHDITVQDTNGCLDATIRAFVINYPRFFTPNGDQQNDTWNIFSLREVNPNAKIYIFDRYGKFIKQISPMGVGWDGTFNGETLPSTDYWFTVEYEENGESKIFKAHFSLKR